MIELIHFLQLADFHAASTQKHFLSSNPVTGDGQMGIRETTLSLLIHRHTHELLAPCMPAPETSAATNSPYDAQLELSFPDDNVAPPSGSQA
jgi:hypothetical protein